MTRKPKRKQPRMTKADIHDAVLISCAMHGCTCKPDITTRHIHGVTHTLIAHDKGCPAHP